MNEIEVKARLENRQAVEEKIKALGFIPHNKKHQRDVIFFPNDVTAFDEHSLGRNFLRIRDQEEEGGERKIFFTLKQPRSNQTDCIEYEIEVQHKDIGALSSLIKTLGFYEFISVEKTRISGKIGDDVEVCLDEVNDLGSFIELEKFGPEEDASKIQEELYDLLLSWGIKKEDFAYDGYDILVYKARNNK